MEPNNNNSGGNNGGNVRGGRSNRGRGFSDSQVGAGIGNGGVGNQNFPQQQQQYGRGSAGGGRGSDGFGGVGYPRGAGNQNFQKQYSNQQPDQYGRVGGGGRGSIRGGRGGAGDRYQQTNRTPDYTRHNVVREEFDTGRHGGARFGFNPREVHTVIPFRNFEEELKRPGVWETNQGSTSTTTHASRENLAKLFEPPFGMMYRGSFEKAKEAAKTQDRWLLVNLQSTREFSSHMLNRDTWANEVVAQIITSNFIFWQVWEDSEDGSKIKTYYKLDSVPVTLVIDPVTGQKMRLWGGMIHPENLLEDLLHFMDGSPKDHHFTLSHKRPQENSQAPSPKIHATSVVADEEDEDMKLALALSMETMKDIVKEPSKGSNENNTEICRMVREEFDTGRHGGRMFQEVVMETQTGSETSSLDKFIYNLEDHLKDSMFFI